MGWGLAEGAFCPPTHSQKGRFSSDTVSGVSLRFVLLTPRHVFRRTIAMHCPPAAI